jgi:hypothetical protein
MQIGVITACSSTIGFSVSGFNIIPDFMSSFDVLIVLSLGVIFILKPLLSRVKEKTVAPDTATNPDRVSDVLHNNRGFRDDPDVFSRKV